MWHKNQGDRDAFDRRQINEWITNSRVPFLYFFTRTEIVTDLKLLPVVVVGGEQGLSYHTEK